MEFKNIRSRIYLLFVFFCLSWFAVAQITEMKDIQQLQGKWELEDVLIEDMGHTIHVDYASDYGQFYPEIEVKENMVYLKENKEKVHEVKYEVDGNYLGLDLPPGESLIAEWVILEDKLYLEFDRFHPDDTSKRVKVLLVYTKNK